MLLADIFRIYGDSTRRTLYRGRNLARKRISILNTTELLRTEAWIHRRGEVFFEILAVCLPVLLYGLSTALSRATDKPLELHYFIGIPDALFGGCILFALTTIQAFSFRESARYAELRARRQINVWRWLSLVGLIGCSSLSTFAVIYHPEWALPLGLVSIWFGSLGYKSVVFCREFLSRAIGEDSPPAPNGRE